MFGGYSRKLSQDWALATMQSVGLSHVKEEEEMFLDSESDTNRFSAAVTLKDGSVILTGGKNRPKEVFRLSIVWGNQDLFSERRADMSKGRYGHASAVLNLQGEEKVIVAGGCDGGGEVQASVEIYSMDKDSWTMGPDLLTPRIYFALQVENTGINNNSNSFFRSKIHQFVLLEATIVDTWEKGSFLGRPASPWETRRRSGPVGKKSQQLKQDRVL